MSKMKRGLAGIGVPVAAALALGVFASSALATQATAEANWTISGATFVNGQPTDCEASGTLALATTIGTTAIKITATKVECFFAALRNFGTTALDSGKLILSNLKVDGGGELCTASGPIETNSLTSTLVTTTETAAVPSGLGDTFVPTQIEEEGKKVTPVFVRVELNPGCGALAGTYPVRGSVVGESSKLGVLAVKQPLKFSSTVNKGFTEDALTFGGKAAVLTGSVNNFLTGTNAGKEWGAIK
jgi:hypothetical protein